MDPEQVALDNNDKLPPVPSVVMVPAFGNTALETKTGAFKVTPALLLMVKSMNWVPAVPPMVWADVPDMITAHPSEQHVLPNLGTKDVAALLLIQFPLSVRLWAAPLAVKLPPDKRVTSDKL